MRSLIESYPIEGKAAGCASWSLAVGQKDFLLNRFFGYLATTISSILFFQDNLRQYHRNYL
jgi:hypothetical protein